MEVNGGLALLCSVDSRFCALPLESVIQTTRPLTIEPVSGTPPFVLGLSVIRGMAVPVVDAGRLLSGRPSSSSRFVLLRVGERRVALAVEKVLGVRAVDAIALDSLPPLIRNADADAISSIGALDAELLLLLSAVRIVPDDLLASMDARALAS